MQRIIPNIWLNDTASQMVEFYQSVFDNVEVHFTSHYSEVGQEIHGHQAGQVLTIEFSIDGFRLIALNGGDQFILNNSISLSYFCSTAEQVDQLYHKLKIDGQVHMPLDTYPFAPRYAWISDAFGVSWQIIQADKLQGQTIAPHLSFTQQQAGRASEAMALYTSIFENSQVEAIHHYGPDQTTENPNYLSHGNFNLQGEPFSAMDNSQPDAPTFNPGVSLMVECQNQAEIDHLWSALSTDPKAEACGWLTDTFGVSWQITPSRLNHMLQQGTPAQIAAVTQAYMPMKKFDLAKLEKVYEEAR